MKPEEPILIEIKKFFDKIFIMKTGNKGYRYASYREEWLDKLLLKETGADESKSARTTKELQKLLKQKFAERIKIEAPVAEGMTLRFNATNSTNDFKIDSFKLQAFDILDLQTGTAFEISLSDAFAEFFKDVLKSLLDSRVKKLYLCMRNHNYKGASKSGFIKVYSSEMVQQYIMLARLYKLDIILVDLFPQCNSKLLK